MKTKQAFWLLVATMWLAAPVLAQDWPQFRGTNASGIADGYPLVAKWSLAAKEKPASNVLWKTKITGMGHACPIVSGNRVFIVTAAGPKPESLLPGLYGNPRSVKDNPKQKWWLICLHKWDGSELWRYPLREAVPKVKRHLKATHANGTPATDGHHVVVLLGSGELFCFDVCGELLWKKHLGVLNAGWYRVPADEWGYGSSPIIYRDRIIVQCDIQKNSFVAAYRLHDGKKLWRKSRSDVPTWSTPAVFTSHGRTQIVLNGYRHAGGYDPQTGEELWQLNGGGDIPVPTPISVGNLILLSSSHGPTRPLLAIKGNAAGKIALTAAAKHKHVAWYQHNQGIYLQTPLVYRDLLYACKINGLLSVYDATSGKLAYRKRLGRGRTGFTSSPVAGDGKVYFTAEDGSVYVVRAGKEFKLLATNTMNEICMATPALSSGLILMRTKDHVVAIGQPPQPTPRRRFRLLRRLLGQGS